VDCWTGAGYGKDSLFWDFDLAARFQTYNDIYGSNQTFTANTYRISAGRELPREVLDGNLAVKVDLPFLQYKLEHASGESGLGDIKISLWHDPFEIAGKDFHIKFGAGLQLPTADEDLVGPDNDLDLVLFAGASQILKDFQYHVDYEMHLGEDQMLYFMHILAGAPVNPDVLVLGGFYFANPTEYDDDEVQMIQGLVQYAIDERNQLGIALGLGLNDNSPDFEFSLSGQFRMEF
jgi:hypothetical protein